MLIDHTIKNLNGGVSQQPDELRFDTQVEDMVNFMPTKTGTVKTLPNYNTSSLGNLNVGVSYDKSAVHYYDRGDGLEKYFMIMNENGLRVFDLESNEQTVNAFSINGFQTDEANIIEYWNFESSIEKYARTYIYNESVTLGGGFLRLKDSITGEYLFLDMDADIDEIVYLTITKKTHEITMKLDSPFIIYSESWFYFYIWKKTQNQVYSVVFQEDGQGGYEVKSSTRTIDFVFQESKDWRKDIEFLTVGDTTFVLNKDITPEMDGSKVIDINKRNVAFYWAKRSFDDGQGSGYDYTVNINGIKFNTNATSSESAVSSLSTQINQQYSSVGNDPSIFQDWIRAVAIGSILHIYVARVYAPDFRLKTGYIDGTFTTTKSTTNEFVRVRNIETGAVEGLSVSDYETSFKLISGKYEIYLGGYYTGSATATIDDFYDVSSYDWGNNSYIETYYYSNSSQAVSNTSPENIFQPIYVSNKDDDFTFEGSDSWGDQASVSWKRSISKISDLPSDMNGFSKEDIGTIEITGTDKDNFTSYYLNWNEDRWSEGIKDGILYSIDENTLLGKIVRQQDGSFVIGLNIENVNYDGFSSTWTDRDVGDDYSNPIPSFIGSKISNIFFFKNRLCFTSGENVIMSEVGEYYNFFATTAMEVLDSDPIDVAVDSNTVTDIKSVNLVGNGATLWSKKGQFFLSGGDILSPQTVRISQVSSYEALDRLKPVSLDNEVYYFNESGGYIQTNIYSPATVNQDNTTSESVSAHCPRYVPAGYDIVVSSPKHNMIFLAKADTIGYNEIYCYKYYIKGQERIMSAWFKILCADTFKIINMFIDEDNLCIVSEDAVSSNPVQYGNRLRKIDISENSNVDSYLINSCFITMSKFNIEEPNNIRDIRDDFFMTSVKVNKEGGDIELDIINEERNSTKIISESAIPNVFDRNIHIGSNSKNISLKFFVHSSNTEHTEIGAISIQGRANNKSRNI